MGISFAQWLQEHELRGVKNWHMGARPMATQTDMLRKYSPFKFQPPELQPIKPVSTIFRKPGSSPKTAKKKL